MQLLNLWPTNCLEITLYQVFLIPVDEKAVWIKYISTSEIPFVLSSLATTFCSVTFQIITKLSALALANMSGLWGHQDMAVIVFLCSDIIARSLNSLYR